MEPAAPVEEVRAEAAAMAGDEPDVAAQRVREKPTDEGRYPVYRAFRCQHFVILASLLSPYFHLCRD